MTNSDEPQNEFTRKASQRREISRRDFLKLLTTGGAAAFLTACAAKAAQLTSTVVAATATPGWTATPLPRPTITPTPAPKSMRERIQDRLFPSVFMAWNTAQNLSGGFETEAAHYDLIITNEWEFELWWDGSMYPGEGTAFVAERLEIGRSMHEKLVAKNPNALVLAEVRYRDAAGDWLPENSPAWQRDAAGKRVPGWSNYYMLDWHTPAARTRVAAQARAFVESGIYDGVFFDWWDDRDPDRIKMLEEVRGTIGGDKLILVNSNTSQIPHSAAYVNGIFMEAVFWSSQTQSSNGPTTAGQWRTISNTLLWAEKNLLEPHINALETKYADFTQNLNRLRATTTLALTHSDGYTLFANENHDHRWDPFWDHKELGRPLAAMIERPDGAIQREYSGGTVVYNPMGNAAVKVTFEEMRLSAANGQSAREFSVDGTDGDLFLKPI